MERRGLFFDVAILIGNVFFAGWFTDFIKRTDGGAHPLVGLILLLAVVAYIVGALWKRRPLHARLHGREPLAFRYQVLFFCLSIMHLAVFMMLCMAGLEPLGVGLNQNWGAMVMLAGAALATIAMLRGLIAPRESELLTPALKRQEIVADVALCFAVLIIMGWWDGTLGEYLAQVQTESLIMAILAAVMFCFPLAVFYLPPRMLFLFEDFRERGTWWRILLVMLPLASRVIYGHLQGRGG